MPDASLALRQEVLAALQRGEARPDLAKALAPLLLPAAFARRDRLNQRDAAIRDAAAALFPGLARTAAAKELSIALGRYAATGWLRERHLSTLPDEAGMRRQALHRIMTAADGAPPGWRQVVNVLDGTR